VNRSHTTPTPSLVTSREGVEPGLEPERLHSVSRGSAALLHLFSACLARGGLEGKNIFRAFLPGSTGSVIIPEAPGAAEGEASPGCPPPDCLPGEPPRRSGGRPPADAGALESRPM